MTEGSSNHPCEVCKSNAGQAYRFYYGDRAGEKVEVTKGTGYTATTTTTTWTVGGQRGVVLCSECVTKDWQGRMEKALKNTLICGAITALLVILLVEGRSLPAQSSADIVVWLYVLLVGVALVLGWGTRGYALELIRTRLEKGQTRGERAAISVEQAKGQHTAFWTQADYRRQATKNKGKPTVERIRK